MRFRLLGSLEVFGGGRAVAIGSRRQRALLTMLLLHANEVVSADRLLGAVWGGPELVAEREALVAEQPLGERLRRQLMLALYRAGRQAEALAVFRETRRALMDELGIEPGAELRWLEREILLQAESPGPV